MAFGFAKIGTLLRVAYAALAGGDFKIAANAAADVFDALGSAETGEKIRAEVKAIGDGDTRAVALNALNLVCAGLGLGFGWTAPLVVSATGDGGHDEASDLMRKCTYLADCCEAEAKGPTKMGATVAGMISPELLMVLLQSLPALLKFIHDLRHPTQQAAPAKNG